jgi:regulation of enolase protein 1 (concanavalin A-like superfamily)
MTNQGIINGPVATTLGISKAMVIAPQNLTRSIMYRRINCIGDAQMPPFGRTTIDVSAVNLLANWINSLSPSSTTLPAPWADQDIGNVTLAGDVAYTSGTFTVSASGTDIWDASDSFHYVYQSLKGNGEIVARVVSVQNTDPWAKAGVMIRETLTAGSKHSMVVVTPDNKTEFQRRTETDDTSDHTPGPTVVAPCWVKLTRNGSAFCGYVSTNGSTWTLIDAVAISMAENVYIGIAVTAHNNEVPDTFYDREVTAHNNGTLNTSILDNVHVTVGLNELAVLPPLAPAHKHFARLTARHHTVFTLMKYFVGFAIIVIPAVSVYRRSPPLFFRRTPATQTG